MIVGAPERPMIVLRHQYMAQHSAPQTLPLVLRS